MRALGELFLISLCILAYGLVGNGLYSSTKDFGIIFSARLFCVRLGYVALLMVLVWLLYRSRLRRFGAQPVLWWGVFLAAILAGASADSWQAWLEFRLGAQSPQALKGAILYSILFFLVLAFVRSRLSKIPPRSLINIREDDPEGRKHLILFLSDITEIPAWLSGGKGNLEEDLARLAQEKRESASQNRRPQLWPWEQSLRAISHHLGKNTLKAVSVIASEKSIHQAQSFANVIAAYPILATVDFRLLVKTKGGAPKLVRLGQLASESSGWCFEDFTELSKAVHDLLWLLQKEHYQDSDLMIDFTSGKKVTSVVAATVTFNREVKAQYVETEDPWKVRSYKLVTAAELGPGT